MCFFSLVLYIIQNGNKNVLRNQFKTTHKSLLIQKVLLQDLYKLPNLLFLHLCTRYVQKHIKQTINEIIGYYICINYFHKAKFYMLTYIYQIHLKFIHMYNYQHHHGLDVYVVFNVVFLFFQYRHVQLFQMLLYYFSRFKHLLTKT